MIGLLKLTKLHMSARKQNSACENQRGAQCTRRGKKCACVFPSHLQQRNLSIPTPEET